MHILLVEIRIKMLVLRMRFRVHWTKYAVVVVAEQEYIKLHRGQNSKGGQHGIGVCYMLRVLHMSGGDW